MWRAGTQHRQHVRSTPQCPAHVQKAAKRNATRTTSRCKVQRHASPSYLFTECEDLYFVIIFLFIFVQTCPIWLFFCNQNTSLIRFPDRAFEISARSFEASLVS